MAWHEPPSNDANHENNNPNNNPWNDNKKQKNSGPPDLFALLQKFLGGKSGGGHSKGGKEVFAMLPFILLVIAAAFAYAGFFVVQPGEEAAVFQFGKYTETVGPGPHWVMPVVQSQETVNTRQILRVQITGQMITKEVNIVNISLAVQYRIGDLKDYLFSVRNPNNSLIQAGESAMRQVIANLTLDESLSTNIAQQGVAQNINGYLGERIKTVLVGILDKYKIGIDIIGVEILSVKPPEKVQDAFNDAIKAQEDEDSYINQAKAYTSKLVPLAHGDAARITAEAKAYAEKVVLDATGDAMRFNALVAEYGKNAPLMRSRMYITALERLFSQNKAIIVDSKAANNLMYLPVNKLLENSGTAAAGNVAVNNRINN